MFPFSIGHPNAASKWTHPRSSSSSGMIMLARGGDEFMQKSSAGMGGAKTNFKLARIFPNHKFQMRFFIIIFVYDSKLAQSERSNSTRWPARKVDIVRQPARQLARSLDGEREFCRFDRIHPAARSAHLPPALSILPSHIRTSWQRSRENGRLNLAPFVLRRLATGSRASCPC